MLIILDMDGTLITRFHGTATLRPYADVQLLPGVAVRVAALRQAGATLAVATNQGGVAFGYQTRAEVVTKLQRVAQALGYRRAIIADGATMVARPAADTLLMLIAYGHPDAHDPALRTPAQLARRKPGGGMLREAHVPCSALPLRTRCMLARQQQLTTAPSPHAGEELFDAAGVPLAAPGQPAEQAQQPVQIIGVQRVDMVN